MSENAFDFSQWAVVIPASDWTFAVGEFIGQDKTNLVDYHPSQRHFVGWRGIGNDIVNRRLEILRFWEKHRVIATCDALHVSQRTLCKARHVHFISTDGSSVE